MNIKNIKDKFSKNEINKANFVAAMHEFHMALFEFSKNLSDTEIEKIEIEDNKVIFTSRKTKFHPGGVKFYVDCLDKRITPIEAFNFNYYEQEESEMLYNLVGNDEVIFDIGANIGWYSNHLSKKLPNSLIYAFEPIPETFEQISKNTQLNKAINIKLNNVALSDKVQKLSFFYSPNITGASSSVNITENENMLKLECQTNTIDLFIKEQNISKLDFIKCDVEGAELLVYKGGAESIEKYKPIVFTEMLRKWALKFDYHPNDIIDFFTKLGYKCFVASEGRLKSIEKVTDDTIETNFFFLHSNKHADKIKNLS
ncbi:MAG: FkbM family methyltransferase [Sphingobacteriaceae bacterium]|nr:FkbM family methyltransferase [Sphingobacteriaceae bacterium]